MARISLELPLSVHQHAKRMAKRDGVSVKQLISSALAEKLAVLDAEDHIKSRAKRANRKAYDEILATAPARKPLKGDEWPGEN
jgi:hypothetical protein